MEKNKEIVEIDIARLWKAIWRRAWLIVLTAILCGAMALLITVYLITPQYQATAMFYVNNSSVSIGDSSVTIDSADIIASKNLVDTYIVILNSRSCLNDVIDYANLDYGPTQLKGMITASSVNSTEVFQVVITGPDPEEAEKIANAIAYILPNKISDIVEGTSAKVVDYAIVPSAPSSPNKTTNTALGFVLGFVFAVAVIAILELLDNTVRSEEDITQISKHPILASVPDMAIHSKGGYYYDGYVKKKSKKKKLLENESSKNVVLVGDGISFAASEAYKLLRTKIQFSFADDKNCRVLGISSALAGEGKSLSSVNLAYSLAQLGKKVLLIDCDMRRPSLAVKLDIERVPGLSNYLAGRIGIDVVLQTYGADAEDKVPFHVITAGRVPPNPIELLSSEKMAQMLEKLRECYDYIVLDLPPVGEVSDAIVAAKIVDGVLMVVCQNYCSRNAFSHAIEQFEFVNSRILGIVMNRVSERGRGYYRYGKRYYKKYYGYRYQSKSND